MRRWIAQGLFALNLIATCVLPSLALSFEIAENMATVQGRIAELARKHGPERTLIVFDIDNTLLRMKQDLGSDAWYRWQRHLQKTKPTSRFLVSPRFNDLLDVQELLYELSDMRAVEDTTPALVDALIQRGHPVVAMTARAPETWSATLRELNDAGYKFSSALACGPPLCWRRGIISSSQLITAAQHARFLFPGLTRLVGKNPRPIMYGNGIMLVAGQNKGAMLQLLLASSDHRRIASIVFIDDTIHNVENVDKAFDQTVREIEVFRYAFMDADVDDFLVNGDRKRISSDSWSSLRFKICVIFGRFCP